MNSIKTVLLGPLEVGFTEAEFRVVEGNGITIPFQILSPADPSTLPGTVFVTLQVAVIDGTAICKMSCKLDTCIGPLKWDTEIVRGHNGAQ